MYTWSREHLNVHLSRETWCVYGTVNGKPMARIGDGVRQQYGNFSAQRREHGFAVALSGDIVDGEKYLKVTFGGNVSGVCRADGSVARRFSSSLFSHLFPTSDNAFPAPSKIRSFSVSTFEEIS